MSPLPIHKEPVPVRETVVVTPVNTIPMSQSFSMLPGTASVVTIEFDIATSGAYDLLSANPPGVEFSDGVYVTMGHLLDVWAFANGPGIELWISEAINNGAAFRPSAKFLLTSGVVQPVRGFRISANYAQVSLVNNNVDLVPVTGELLVRVRTI